MVKNLRKSYRLIIAAVISTLMVLPFALLNSPQAVNKNFSVEAFTNYLNERIPQLMNAFNVPGLNISLIENHKNVWSRSFGYADLENKRKMTIDTYCRIESISKSVTAWGIMRLVEQDRIKLEDPVFKYIQNWKFPGSDRSAEKITIRQLLTHTAGLTLGNIGITYSPLDTIPTLRQSLTQNIKLFQEPGQSFSYSNTGYHLLELLIEEVTGQSFEEYMKNEVLIPLGMNKSTFVWKEDFYPPVANGYDLKGNPVPVYVYPEKAAGGLFSTLEDIVNFVIAGMVAYEQRGGPVLNRQGIEKIYDTYVKPGQYSLAFDYYGFGHFIEYLPDGKKAVASGGQGTGWMTHFHSVPETGDGIVILTNSQRSWPLFAYLLTDWAKWNGFGSVGMSIIIKARVFMWTIIGILLTFSLWQFINIMIGLIHRNLRPVKLKELLLLKNMAKLLSAMILSAILLWSVRQKYLFITAVFPVASSWLGYAILFSGLALIVAAFIQSKKIPNS